MEQVTTLIENLGFPIVLSIYLLIRFEKKIDLLNYCKENKIPFSIDYTNDDINLKRNYLIYLFQYNYPMPNHHLYMGLNIQ